MDEVRERTLERARRGVALHRGDARPARAPAQRDDAADAPARRAGVYAPERRRPAGRGAPRGTVPSTRPSRSATPATASPTTTSAPPPVELPAFEIDRAPVTNGAVPRVRRGRRLPAPRAVDRGGLGAGARRARSGRSTGPATAASAASTAEEPLDPDLPVMHVSWFEADAYARWRGAGCRPRPSGRRRRLGRAPRSCFWSDGARGAHRPARFGPAAGPGPSWATAGSGPPATSAATRASAPYPYREYSEVFFGGGYKVLRGGSWATRPRVARATFRNWDHPQRRQIFAGFRCGSPPNERRDRGHDGARHARRGRARRA